MMSICSPTTPSKDLQKLKQGERLNLRTTRKQEGHIKASVKQAQIGKRCSRPLSMRIQVFQENAITSSERVWLEQEF